MTEIYIEETESVDDGEKNIYLFATLNDALNEACSDILSAIEDTWDLEDDEELNNAKSIQILIQNRDYRGAISEYNDLTSDRNYPFFIYVNTLLVNSSGRVPSLIDFSKYENEDDESVDSAIEQSNAAPYYASIPGAKCRCCHNYNDEAYADRCDGTFECFGCKLMKQAFQS